MSQTKVKSGLLNFPDQTDFVKLPSGTTAQRPYSPEKGYSRYNTTDNKLEYWNGAIWQQLPGVVPPTITSVSYPGDDLAADPDGGQTITLTGTNFLNGASIEIDGTTASVVTVVSATEITFTAPAKTAGDYDIILTNGDSGTATYVDGITYNGLPSWTTSAGNLGSFAAGSTIPTITLVATEPDSGVVSYSVTTGALPSGLTLTGADIDGTVPSPVGQTTYNFSVTASDDENQESTERAFNIVVYLQVTNTVDDHDPFDGNGVALYQLNGDATDVSGNYDGTASNLNYVAGQFGQGASFNTSNSLLTAPRSFSTNSPYSVSGWVKIANGSTTQAARLFWQITGTNQTAVQVYYNGADSYAFGVNHKFETNGGFNYSFAANDGQWHHYAMTFDESFANLYIDGANVASGALDPKADVSSTFYIGGSNVYNGITYYNGLDGLDQVRYFTRALDPLEVESLYRERTVLCGGQADTLDILGDNSCIATYQLNGNANDLSGNYSGTPTDVSYGVGEFDLAGVFNGSSSGILLNNLRSYLSGSPFSVSMWLKTSSSGVYNYPISGSGTDLNNSFSVELNPDGTFRFYFLYGGSPIFLLDCPAVINDNNWNHIVAQWDGTTNTNAVKVYVNGSLNQQGTSNTNVSSTSINVDISLGKATNPATGYWNGSIDQVRIFNKALNSTEVTTLYNETACDFYIDIDADAARHWGFDNTLNSTKSGYSALQKTSATYSAGRFGSALNFNRGETASETSTSYGDIWTEVTKANFLQGSVSFWFKPNNVNQRNIVTYSEKIPFFGLEFGVSNKLEISSFIDSEGDIFSPETYGTSDIIFVCINAVRVGGVGSTQICDFTMYYSSVSENNLKSITSTGTSTESTSTDTFCLGHGASSVGFGGWIDQFRLFDKPLNLEEVQELFNEQPY